MKTFTKASLLTIALAISSSALAQANNRERALIAYLKVIPGEEQTFLRAAQNVIAESRQEAGNLVYILHQSVTTPQQFMFYELFKSDADLQYHRRAKHVVDFLNEVKPILVPGQFILEEYKVN